MKKLSHLLLSFSLIFCLSFGLGITIQAEEENPTEETQEVLNQENQEQNENSQNEENNENDDSQEEIENEEKTGEESGNSENQNETELNNEEKSDASVENNEGNIEEDRSSDDSELGILRNIETPVRSGESTKMLLTSTEVRSRIKSLVGNFNQITAFVRNWELPDASVERRNIENTSSGPEGYHQIVVWFDSGSGTLYWYSSADKIQFDWDSEKFFQGWSAIEVLDLRDFFWHSGSAYEAYSFFEGCSALKEIKGLENWTTHTWKGDMSGMFAGCRSLESAAIENWDVSQVTNMKSMFTNCFALKSLDLSRWNTSSVTNMYGVFNGCTGLTSLNVTGWNTAKVTDMQFLFNSCRNLTEIDTSSFDTGNVTRMYSMFAYCHGLKSLDLRNFNTANTIQTGSMFTNCSALESVDISGWDTSKNYDMSVMFSYCTSLTEIKGIEDLNVSAVQSLNATFEKCPIEAIDLSKWETPALTTTAMMFTSCTNLKTIDISNLNTSGVTTFNAMFYDCPLLEEIKGVENFDTSNATNFYLMFSQCSALKSLDLSSFDTSKATTVLDALNGCTGLYRLALSSKTFVADSVPFADTNLPGEWLHTLDASGNPVYDSRFYTLEEMSALTGQNRAGTWGKNLPDQTVKITVAAFLDDEPLTTSDYTYLIEDGEGTVLGTIEELVDGYGSTEITVSASEETTVYIHQVEGDDRYINYDKHTVTKVIPAIYS